MTLPKLRMGLIGFADDEFLARVLRTRVTVPWEKWAPIDADALWINGSSAQVLDNGMVRVVTSDFPPVSTTLDLGAIQKPHWFSLPLADPALHAPAVFNPQNAASIDNALRTAEKLLLPLALQLAVAGKLIASVRRLASPAYELWLEGELVGLVNVAHWIALHPRLRPHDIGEAECVPRTERVPGLPLGFMRLGFAEAVWVYAKRTRLELLPDKYLTLPLLFRAVPKIRRRLLGDVDLLVLSELMAAPLTLDKLQESTRLRPEILMQTLTALYLAGSITTDPAKAAAIQNLLRKRMDAAPPPEVPEFRSLPPAEGPPEPVKQQRPTVPGSLEALRRSTKE